jgi:hypothetical protein
MANQTSQAVQAVDELLALEALRRHCLVERDFDTLQSLFADELTYVHSTGKVQNRAAYLAYVQGPLRFLSIERPHLSVRLHADLALMTGTMVNTIVAPELPQPLEVSAFVTQVWKRGGEQGWQIANFQATRLPDTAAGKPA